MKTIDPDQKEQIEAMVAEEGVAPAVLEKDIHVTDLLTALFQQPRPSGLRIAFGGGTALSKCFQLIQRMSEEKEDSFDFRLLRHVYDIHAIQSFLAEPLNGELVRTLIDTDRTTRKWVVTSNSFIETVKRIGSDTTLPDQYEQLVEDLMVGEIISFDRAFETFFKIASEIESAFEKCTPLPS
jgi:predicted nucleotidyltransferase component of viral defense system